MKDIKIFISCHKDFKVLDNKLLHPIQVGTALAKQKLDMFHDNDSQDGNPDNISDKNRQYCELTAQYWVWKHVKADYYGFFHYRRYFSFKKPKRWLVAYQRSVKDIDSSLRKTENLNEEAMQSLIEKYDVIAPRKIFFLMTNKMQYSIAKHQHWQDMQNCLDIIDRDFPQFSKIAHRYMHKSMGYVCNMFVMKKEIFDDYCQWLFHILQKNEKERDYSSYTGQDLRVSGFLAERLCGIYLTYLKKVQKKKIAHLDVIKFKNVTK